MKSKKYIRLVIMVSMVILLGLQVGADDKELFMVASTASTSTVRPNVMILMDNSASMNTIVYYPKKGLDKIAGTADDGYDPTITYTGTFDNYGELGEITQTQWFGRWIKDGNANQYNTTQLENIGGKNHWTGCYAGDGTPNNFQVGSNSSYFNVGDKILWRDGLAPYTEAVATIKRKYTNSKTGQPWFELENIVGGPIVANADTVKSHFQRSPDGYNRVPVVIRWYGTSDNGNAVRIPENYAKWVYIYNTVNNHPELQTAVSHYSLWGTFDVTKTPAPVLSNCCTPGNDNLSGSNPRIKKVFTRIQTAREVICNVAKSSNKIVRLGLFKFNSEEGGTLQSGLNDMSDESSELVSYKNKVWDIPADAWTPLAETMADIWKYYKPGPSSKTYWPVDYEIKHSTVNHSTANPVSPIQYYCQNNYVVIMTDGESTKDRFDSGFTDSIFKTRPVKRIEPWVDDGEWVGGWGDVDDNDACSGIPCNYRTSNTYCPSNTCWSSTDGSDYLDDMAYFLKNQDMFPDDYFTVLNGAKWDWVGDQKIYTYTIGFNMDNHLLLQTAINGEGAYYVADNYDELVNAFQLVITSINLRNYAFSSITAPKKTATATNEELTVSYVGYFLPSASASIWEGHLLAFRLIDLWGYDENGDGKVSIDDHEFNYKTQEDCLGNSSGQPCQRWVELPIGHEWDAVDKMPAERNLFTHNDSTTLIDFTLANRDTLMPLFSSTTTTAEAEMIINKIRTPQLADIFHSDVGFIGPPPYGKQFSSNINPMGAGDETYATYYNNNKNRTRVIYTGTNDGILHMFYADGVDAGQEIWGFIPDAVLPSLRPIVLDSKHTYTVDGRLSATDLYYVKPGDTVNTWATLLFFGLRQGGKYYYAMDITTVGDQPTYLWKFTDSTYSGQSWGKPNIGRIKVVDPSDSSKTIDKWVAVLTGGFAFNSENSSNLQGKAIFIIDAVTGVPYYILAYHPLNGAPDIDNGSNSPEVLEVDSTDDLYYLTKSDRFNFPIPSSLTVIDKDANGYIDTLYFGNLAGHMFKTDISSLSKEDWTTYVLYTTPYTPAASYTNKRLISSISTNVLTLSSKPANGTFNIGETVFGLTSKAVGYITAVSIKDVTINYNYGTFAAGEYIVTRTDYDPIYEAPALAYDNCYQLWVYFGTGDRERPRTDPVPGRFIAIKDEDKVAEYTNLLLADLTQLAWTTDADGNSIIAPTSTKTKPLGWYFNFPDTAEKLFDPEPIVLPDEKVVPHIYFNTYQPPAAYVAKVDDPCDQPKEGIMTLYNISIKGCGTEDIIEGESATGRIAGGGIYEGKEYVMYTSESGNVADVPGEEGGKFIADPKRLPYPGGLVFWKEKKH